MGRSDVPLAGVLRRAGVLEDLLFKPENSLVVQSKHSKLGATTTNGDGFGVGWYGAPETPGVFRSTEPAWNDRNLRELSALATRGGCSPTSAPRPARRSSRPTATRSATGDWLWMHNGCDRGLPRA